MVFLVVTYGSESWTIKKAECQRIDAFELWCWRRLLRVPLTARRSNQSILKEISPEYSLEGLMLKWTLQYFGYPMQGADSLVQLVRKDPNARKHWRQEKKGMTEDEIVGWHHWLNGYEFEQVPGVGEGQGSPACCNFMELQRVGRDRATELNWYSKLKKKNTLYITVGFSYFMAYSSLNLLTTDDEIEMWIIFCMMITKLLKLSGHSLSFRSQ